MCSPRGISTRPAWEIEVDKLLIIHKHAFPATLKKNKHNIQREKQNLTKNLLINIKKLFNTVERKI